MPRRGPAIQANFAAPFGRHPSPGEAVGGPPPTGPADHVLALGELLITPSARAMFSANTFKPGGGRVPGPLFEGIG